MWEYVNENTHEPYLVQYTKRNRAISYSMLNEMRLSEAAHPYYPAWLIAMHPFNEGEFQYSPPVER